MKKRLLFLCLIAGALAMIGAGEHTGYIAGTITDSISPHDTMIDSVRIDSAIYGPFTLNGYETFQYVWLAEVRDTSFTDDTTYLIFQGGLLVALDTVWLLTDTLILDTTNDTTGTYPLYGLDTLAWDLGRFVAIYWDSNEVTQPLLVTNTYDHALKIAFRRTK